MPDQPAILLALYGPTSAGKTALSVQLALRVQERLRREVVIISADSRQVYRSMTIGTSKTTPDEMRGIRHEMLDVVEPIRKLELEDYTRLAGQHITDCLAAGAIPFIVGGTGIYVKALLEQWPTGQVEHVGANRDWLRREFPRALTQDAYAMLRRLNRDTAARVHPNNYEAIINALATTMAPPASTPQPAPAGRVQPIVFGLNPPARALEQRVADTYDNQVRRGLFDEILDLAARYDLDHQARRRQPSDNQVLHTHGYREYFDVAVQRGKPVARLTDRDRAEVRTQVIDHIQRYTRRQRAFLAKLPDLHTVTTADAALNLITERTRPAKIPSRAARPSGRRRDAGR